PHPGITTMWLSVLTIDSESWAVRRLPIAMATVALIVAAAYFVIRLWGIIPGILVGLLLAFNPILIAHSRVLAMDALLAMFLLLGVLAFLIWMEEKQRIYLILSGATGALAVLSKMSGAVILPFMGIVLATLLLQRRLSWRDTLRAGAVWIAGFLATFVIVFPAILTDFSYVWSGTQEFFATEHYQQAVHALGPWWYLQALLIWTTPLQLLAIIGLIVATTIPANMRRHLLALGGFTLLFFLAMQFSIKKGDRYILPVFITFDVITAAYFSSLWIHFRQGPSNKKSVRQLVTAVLLAAAGLATIWQLINITAIHPYALAYRNPFFRQVAIGRTLGWGEGLDLAAEYLNQKPDAENMLVAAYYEGQFGYRFQGKVTSAERLAKETSAEIGAAYVVLYRTMEGRAPERWETKVLQQFAGQSPEHVIRLNGEDYAWIYNVEKENN
ncbi:MAG: ArnT family glycosyltransferase, partial [Acidobacteriota bacterium]